MDDALRRLPSLDLVRGFVAAGRRLSITLAARDLCLTQSAVSRQIHALERQLGVRLFVRGHRSVAFTPDGERLFRIADPVIGQLHDVLAALRDRGRVKPVTVSATIGFTGLWLLPRLGRFQALRPGVDVRVAANDRVVDLRGDGIDLAIRYTSAERAPAGAMRLFDETIVPVASPASGLRWPRSARELSKLTLLEFEQPHYAWLRWRHWLEAAGWPGTRPRAFLHFNQYDLVIQAALAGQGIALGRRALIGPLLEDGRLVALVEPDARSETGYGYWLIQSDPAPRAEVAEVANWILREGGLPSAHAMTAPG